MPPSFPSLPLPEAAAAAAHAALLALAALLLLLRATRALASRCASCLKAAPRRGRAAAGGGGGALAATAGAWHRAVLASCAYALLLQVAALSYEVAVAGSRVAAGALLLPAVAWGGTTGARAAGPRPRLGQLPSAGAGLCRPNSRQWPLARHINSYTHTNIISDEPPQYHIHAVLFASRYLV